MKVELLRTILKIVPTGSADITDRPILLNEIVNEVDISKTLVKIILRDLVNEGCLKYVTIGSHAVTLTSAGIQMANSTYDSAQAISQVSTVKNRLFSKVVSQMKINR